MRLICPNCGAQYAVDEAAIPERGREVECSSCGHAWVQARVIVEPGPQRPVVTVTQVLPGGRPAFLPAGGAGEAAMPPPPPRRPIDPEVLAVLREEAAREHSARRSEAAGLELQPELAMPTPAPRPAYVPDLGAISSGARAEDLRPAPRRAAPEAAAKEAALPAPLDDPAPEPAAAPPREAAAEAPTVSDAAMRARGRRLGMALSVAVFAALAGAYVGAQRLAGAVPALSDPIGAYAASIDAGRLWLDSGVRRALGSDAAQQ